MNITQTAIQSVYAIDAEPHIDDRGCFGRIFCRQENSKFDIDMDIVQVNRSLNHRKGTMRGLHYQVAPVCETKRVSCIRGSIFDIILDIRQDSPTFLHWVGIELSAGNMRMIHIPKGCAHGFQTLEPDTEVLYFHSAEYSPDYYRGIRYDDPRLSIKLPLKVSTISTKDANLPLLKPGFSGI